MKRNDYLKPVIESRQLRFELGWMASQHTVGTTGEDLEDPTEVDPW